MFESKTQAALQAAILNGLVYGVDKREGSFASDMAAPIALEMSKVYGALDALLQMFFLDTIGGEYLDLRAGEYGIARKQGTKAVCDITFTGVAETTISAGTTVRTESGLGFSTVSDATISDASVTVQAVALEIGEKYNVAADTLTELSIPGVNSVSNTAAVGGTDIETDDELVERLLYRLRYPATSGNIYHYTAWATAVNGVGAAKVLPLWDGNGTVKVVVTDSDKQPASAEIVEACAAYIEEQRPIGATVTVESAAGVSINVEATVRILSTATVEQVQQDFETALTAYLESIAFKNTVLLYNQVAYILMSVEGVEDFTSLTVNGGSENVTLGETGTPVLGTVMVHAAV